MFYKLFPVKYNVSMTIDYIPPNRTWHSVYNVCLISIS